MTKLVDDLLEIIKDSGARVTFDRFRDITKGCGDHCIGMNESAKSYCENHTQAIRDKEYPVSRSQLINCYADIERLTKQRDLAVEWLSNNCDCNKIALCPDCLKLAEIQALEPKNGGNAG